MFDEMTDAAVIDAIGVSARAENTACARRLAAIAELYERRQVPVEDGEGRELWRFDVWDAVAAEVAAAQCTTAGAAGGLLHYAVCLRERLPRVAAVFATGVIDYRTVRMIVARTLLAVEPEVMAAIDAELAEVIRTWGPMSVTKMAQAVDRIVIAHDPEARRRTQSRARGRHVDIAHDRDISYLTGELLQSDAALLDRRLSALAHTVCDRDPRTLEQRRADALGALAAGHAGLVCACGMSECTAAQNDAAPSVVVHVVAEATALASAEGSDLHGERPEDDTFEVITSRERLAEVIKEAFCPKAPRPATPSAIPEFGFVVGGTAVPVSVLADLAARGIAELRPVSHPGESPPEPRYRPSSALADFLRCRDLTCRFPGCDTAANICDLDHTIPYELGGPTHASNLKALCRKHHLLKTFWSGPGGWHDEQLPDATVIWTSPSGHTYRTQPGSALLIPALCRPTATLNLPRRQTGSCTTGSHTRGAMMPRRIRTRAADRHYRIMAERRL
jgi:hypothetical protein